MKAYKQKWSVQSREPQQSGSNVSHSHSIGGRPRGRSQTFSKREEMLERHTQTVNELHDEDLERQSNIPDSQISRPPKRNMPALSRGN